ncbi:MAG: glutamate mutase L [bacterium]
MELNSILATDCGSTTTKAILIEKRGDEYRLIARGEAPTTVEAPVEDVTKGVINAITEVEELANKKILESGKIIKPETNNRGVDIYISTSSAGGGLQMMVAGVVRNMTAESAERAALGAGAIVMDVIASSDNRMFHESVERIRQLRPDMILLSGGVDGGTVSHIAELAEIIGAADPKPRLGVTYQLPVIFAGNKDARDIVKNILSQKTALDIVDNIRPVLEKENLMPARLKIQDLFLEHVMAHAPGYKELMSWTDAPIMPTPGAVGTMIQIVAEEEKIQVIGVDIGGATTDVFSVFNNIFNRTVSANLGMSYSIANVLSEASLENITRWLPFNMDETQLRNRIKNKMIRPTTIPQTLDDLILEQAIAKEALRLAFQQHKSLAVGLKGIQQQRTISDAFSQTQTGETLVNMMTLDMLVGSGGVLSHAPRRSQAAMMLIDAFLPEGITRLAVDSIFMMPQLGVLAQVNKEAAMQVFKRDCLINLGTCIAPTGNATDGKQCISFKAIMPDGSSIQQEIKYGEMLVIPLPDGEKAKIEIHPKPGFDVGAGNGKKLEAEVHGGIVGIIFDTRGRPLQLPNENKQRITKLQEWAEMLKVYPR